MSKIEFKPGGKELAKVLHYFGLLEGDSNEFKIVCPFHEDINPSMLINLNTGSYFCFGCSSSGDAFTFVKSLYKKLDDLECLKLYFKILRSKKVKKLIFIRKKVDKPSDSQALVEAHDFYFGLKTINWIKDNSPEKQYMFDRGLLPSSLNRCKAKLTYNNNYPIVFPMFDMGEFKGWVCRTTSKVIEKKRKYLYNTGFSRRNTLVGEYNSKQVILVEGYMDWLKLKQFGVKYAAAILGWKITQQQIAKLKAHGVTTIISALDNDVCGKQGTNYLKQFFNVVRFQFPKDVKDPGDLTREQFKKCKRETQREARRLKTNGKK